MKKIITSIILAVMLMASNLYAAGSCTETIEDYGWQIVVKQACTGDSSNGSIPDTALSTAAMSLIKGKAYLILVRAYPTADGTAPDAADVFVLDAVGEDLLGSADGGTTPNKGANLIHATLPKSTMPYSYNMSNWYFFPITSTLTLRVINQATGGANYTIEHTFVR